MALAEFFRDVFDQLASEGALGDPHGALAYAYLRVSSSGQAEEGASGLPRQMLHVHEAALTHRLKIPWGLIFADDHTGFQFKDRPELTRLRNEYKSSKRQANTVVMEYLDRLSRNADWHQGFLLEEMREYGLQVVFWKTFSSRIERAVIGAISQEGMEQAKQRMAEGNIFKARDGRVTARVAAYGYRLVDSAGNEGEKAKKDSHYAIHAEEAEVMRIIFTKVGVEGWSTRRLSAYLAERFPPLKNSSHWEPTQLRLLIKNPVYKGEFVAHRYQEVKVPKESRDPNEPMTFVTKKVQRPASEWITVPVPPIVTPELWDMANMMLAKNSQTAPRNAKEPYLLTGLLRCATCGYACVGNRRVERKGGKEYRKACYRCSSRALRAAHVRHEIGCTQGQIECHFVDDAVWSAICTVLLEPEILLESLERDFSSGPNVQLRDEIAFLEKQLKERDVEDDKLYRAYQADVFDEHEYAARRKQVKDSRKALSGELENLRSQVQTPEHLEGKKKLVLAMAEKAMMSGLVRDAPFETRQKIIKLVVDKVVLNVNEGWCRIEGIIRAQYPLKGVEASIENNSTDRGSWRRRVGSWPGR